MPLSWHIICSSCTQVVSALDQSQGKLVAAMDLVKIIYKVPSLPLPTLP